MNYQETFNKVATHLLTQNARSQGAGHSCAYLSAAGRMCAVGCLFPPDVLAQLSQFPMTNCASVLSLPSYAKLAIGLSEIEIENDLELPTDYKFLMALQDIHDDMDQPIEGWPKALKEFADKHSLSYPTLLKERLSDD